MKVSIVTVAFNEEKTIASTIESVLQQSSAQYEYIVCDGKSTDKTVEKAEAYRVEFEKKGVDYRIFSERDGGVYYGMNHGIDRACSDYILFMNAGDSFYDSESIRKIIDEVKDDRPEVIYGDCQILDNHIKRVVGADHELLREKMSICHQSVLVRTDIIKANKFDTQYKICADYDMMLTFYVRNYRFLKVSAVISTFTTGGISSVKIVDSTREACSIREKHGIPVDWKNELVKAAKNERIIKIKRRIPLFIWKFWSKTINGKDWVET